MKDCDLLLPWEMAVPEKPRFADESFKCELLILSYQFSAMLNQVPSTHEHSAHLPMRDRTERTKGHKLLKIMLGVTMLVAVLSLIGSGGR